MVRHLHVVDVELRRPLGSATWPRYRATSAASISTTRSKCPGLKIAIRSRPEQRAARARGVRALLSECVAERRRGSYLRVAAGAGWPIAWRPRRSWIRGVLPKGPWQLRKLVAVAALCAAQAGVCAQPEQVPEAASEPAAGRRVRQKPRARGIAGPESATAERLPRPRPSSRSRSAAETELPAPLTVDAELPTNAELAAPLQPLPVAAPSTSAAISNDDVRRWSAPNSATRRSSPSSAQTSSQFDLSPRALVALKGGGVSERVIEAMIAAEAEKKRAAVPSSPAPSSPRRRRRSEYARLTADDRAAGREAGSRRGRAARAGAAGVARGPEPARLARRSRPTERRSRRRSRRSRSPAAADATRSGSRICKASRVRRSRS